MQVVKVDKRGRLDRPLDTIVAARSASKEFIVEDVPVGIESVVVRVGRVGTNELSSAAASPRPDGSWDVYLSPLYFPLVGEAEWHLVGRDRNNHAAYMGKGRLKIIESVSDDGGEAPLVPDDTYLRNPVTGLWHKLTAVLEDGEIVPIVEKTGVVR